jgi:hypothetical protein
MSDDLARPVPVSRAEFEVIEAFLGVSLDAIPQDLKR